MEPVRLSGDRTEGGRVQVRTSDTSRAAARGRTTQRILCVLFAVVAAGPRAGEAGSASELRRSIATVASSVAAERLRAAVDSTRELVELLLASWESELRASLPGAPDGWTKAGSTADQRLNRDHLILGEYVLAERYRDAEGNSIEVRLVSPAGKEAESVARSVQDADTDQKFSAWSFRGRWASPDSRGQGRSLTVLLTTFPGPYVEVKPLSGVLVSRSAVLALASPENLARMATRASLGGDRDRELEGAGPTAAACVEALQRWSAKLVGESWDHSEDPLLWTRRLIATLGAALSRQFAEEISGLPPTWKATDTVWDVPPTKTWSRFVRSFHTDGGRVHISLVVGSSDQELFDLPTGIWGDWEVEQVGLHHVRRRRARTGPELQSEIALVADEALVVVTGDSPSAAKDCSIVEVGLDIERIRRFINQR